MNAGLTIERHPNAGTWSAELRLHLGSIGFDETYTYDATTRADWTALQDCASVGGATWTTAGSALVGASVWALLPSADREYIRQTVMGR